MKTRRSLKITQHRVRNGELLVKIRLATMNSSSDFLDQGKSNTAILHINRETPIGKGRLRGNQQVEKSTSRWKRLCMRKTSFCFNPPLPQSHILHR